MTPGQKLTPTCEQFYKQRTAELKAQLRQRDKRIAALEKQVAKLLRTNEGLVKSNAELAEQHHLHVCDKGHSVNSKPVGKPRIHQTVELCEHPINITEYHCYGHLCPICDELVWAEAGAEVMVNGRPIGAAGIFSQAIREKFDFKDLSPVGAELEFEQLEALQHGSIKVKPIPRFPAIQRDLSIIVGEQIRWADIVEVVKSKAPGELEDIRFVGIYRGEGIPAGQKSVTLSVLFRDQDGTLTHEMVDRFQADIVERLSKSIGAELRTV